MQRPAAASIVAVTVALALTCGCNPCPKCPPAMPAASCTFALSVTGTGMQSGGGNVAVLVTTPRGCPWTFQGNDPWITLVPDSEGSAPGNGNGTVVLQVAQNPGQRRTGTATIAYHTVKVDQAGTNGSVCTFQVWPSSVQVPEGGGSGSFTVIPNDENCGWSVDQSATTEDWLSGFVTLNAVGTRTLRYTARACSAPSRPGCPTSGTLSIRDTANQQGATITFSQP